MGQGEQHHEGIANRSLGPGRAMAIAAHPDDIEFLMAGTLLRLGEVGFALHYMTVASGSCGSIQHGRAATRRIRRREAEEGAALLGASFHPSLVDDLEIVYDVRLLRRLAAVVREVAPDVLLLPSPEDYMEDHMATARLGVTAAFARGMPNFRTKPRRRPTNQEVAIYHAMPFGLRDPLRRRIMPELFVDTGVVHATKRAALASHASQQSWLEHSQGTNSYLEAMEEMSTEVGRLSERFEHAEGWRRRSHLGFSGVEWDPIREWLPAAQVVYCGLDEIS